MKSEYVHQFFFAKVDQKGGLKPLFGFVDMWVNNKNTFKLKLF